MTFLSTAYGYVHLFITHPVVSRILNLPQTAGYSFQDKNVIFKSFSSEVRRACYHRIPGSKDSAADPQTVPTDPQPWASPARSLHH